MPYKQACAWVEATGPDAQVSIRYDHTMPPSPSLGEVLVKVEATGVCHSDCHAIFGDTPMEVNIAGHEGVGRIVHLGDGVNSLRLGQRVALPWLLESCGSCDTCETNPVFCAYQKNLGRNLNGTFQQYITAPSTALLRLPEDLSADVIAPLLCGGLTMYSAIKKAALNPGDNVVIPGAGGGLGHLGIQIANFMGADVIAIDAPEKREFCLSLGASHFLDFNRGDILDAVAEITKTGAHAVIVAAGSESAYKQAIPMLRNTGILVCVGLPNSQFELGIKPFEMVVRGIRITGSSVGSHKDIAELLNLASKGRVLPRVENFAFPDLPMVLERLKRYDIKGRAVVWLPDQAGE
jgi:propanol-preferring alcohol dehydrogenase